MAKKRGKKPSSSLFLVRHGEAIKLLLQLIIAFFALLTALIK